MPTFDRTLTCRASVVCFIVAITSPASIAQEILSLATVEDRAFVAEYDGSQQQYVILTPRGFTPDQSRVILIALHGHGSDRWQFVRQGRGERRATRDVAAANQMLLASPDYRAKTSWMEPRI